MEIRWDIDRAEWDRRLAAESAAGAAALQQDWSYGDAARMLGGHALRAAAISAGRAVALAQFTVRSFGLGGLALGASALCARGPIWLNRPDEAEKAEVFQELRRTAPLGRRRALFFSPDEEAPPKAATRAGLRRVMTGYSTATLDLRRDLSELEAAMKGKWRNRLRAAERAAEAGALTLTMSRPRPGECEWLLEREAAQQKANGYRGLPAAFVAAYQVAGDLAERSKAPSKRHGATASRRGTLRLFRADAAAPAAAMLFLTHGRAATYHIGWTSPEGRRNGAHNLLLWNAIRALKREGLRQIDLGGVDTERGAGIARFKLGSGARPLTLCGTYF